MTKRIEWNAPPSLAVIDRAIELIRSGRDKFTCCALECAVYDLEDEGDCWYVYRRIDLYLEQYRMHAFRNGRPLWWDSSASWYVTERIAALKKFKQACIDAAKKE